MYQGPRPIYQENTYTYIFIRLITRVIRTYPDHTSASWYNTFVVVFRIVVYSRQTANISKYSRTKVFWSWLSDAHMYCVTPCRGGIAITTATVAAPSLLLCSTWGEHLTLSYWTMSWLPETAGSTTRSSRVRCTGYSKRSQVSLELSVGDGCWCPFGGISVLHLAVSPACGSAGPRVSTLQAVCYHRPPAALVPLIVSSRGPPACWQCCDCCDCYCLVNAFFVWFENTLYRFSPQNECLSTGTHKTCSPGICMEATTGFWFEKTTPRVTHRRSRCGKILTRA